jgi:NAD(P)-dependent dehydrogenase (short-subunit alcohol dehydrogenase family)
MRLDGRAAVVAGGAGGLGSATVRHLVALGVGVAVLDPDAARATGLVADLGDRGRGGHR